VNGAAGQAGDLVHVGVDDEFHAPVIDRALALAAGGVAENLADIVELEADALVLQLLLEVGDRLGAGDAGEQGGRFVGGGGGGLGGLAVVAGQGGGAHDQSCQEGSNGPMPPSCVRPRRSHLHSTSLLTILHNHLIAFHAEYPGNQPNLSMLRRKMGALLRKYDKI
jgi:hypothetical protein